MYAVIQSGGKQYRVEAGTKLKLEKLEVETGKEIKFDQVLMTSANDKVEIGTPFIEGGVVTGEVISQGRHDKIRIIKFKRRKHHMKQMGHRQWFTEVQITAIGDHKIAAKPAAKKADKVAPAAEKKVTVKKAAVKKETEKKTTAKKAEDAKAATAKKPAAKKADKE